VADGGECAAISRLSRKKGDEKVAALDFRRKLDARTLSTLKATEL